MSEDRVLMPDRELHEGGLRWPRRVAYAGDLWVPQADADAEFERLSAVNDALASLVKHPPNVAQLLGLLRMVDAHYSGSLDHRPPYVRAIREALNESPDR